MAYKSVIAETANWLTNVSIYSTSCISKISIKITHAGYNCIYQLKHNKLLKMAEVF